MFFLSSCEVILTFVLELNTLPQIVLYKRPCNIGLMVVIEGLVSVIIEWIIVRYKYFWHELFWVSKFRYNKNLSFFISTLLYFHLKSQFLIPYSGLCFQVIIHQGIVDYFNFSGTCRITFQREGWDEVTVPGDRFVGRNSVPGLRRGRGGTHRPRTRDSRVF